MEPVLTKAPPSPSLDPSWEQQLRRKDGKQSFQESIPPILVPAVHWTDSSSQKEKSQRLTKYHWRL
jgi:hypothetical protein